MTLNDFFSALAGIFGLLFVVTSMLAMSLSLSFQQMTQPLKNARLVILALLAITGNFGKPGAGWGGWASAAGKFPSGRILCFDDSTVYGYGRMSVAGGAVGHRADAYHLFRQSRQPDEQGPAAARPDRKGKTRRPSPKAPPVKWSKEKSLIVRAMVLAGDRLVIAGPPDLGRKMSGILAYENEEEALSGFRGEKGVVLRHGQQLAVAERPTAGGEIAGEHPDLADEWL